MPKLGPTASRNLEEASRLRRQVPEELQAQLKPGGLNSISKQSVVSVLNDAGAWAKVTSLSPERLEAAKSALLDYLASARGGGSALQALGFTSVTPDDVGAAAYAKLARKALLSYLPKEDVDSARAIKGYLKDPSYLTLALTGNDGSAHTTSGFMHELPTKVGGRGARAIQLDYHSLLEGEPPNVAGGKVALERFLADAQQRHGRADFVFVEVTPEMAERYRAIQPEFRAFAPPGTKSAGDSYTLLALPLGDEARRALASDGKAILDAYVDSWFAKNLGSDWQTSQPEARAAYDEMKRSPTPLWNQPPLPD